MPQVAMSKCFVFTLPNYTEEEYVSILNNNLLSYCVIGKKICPTTGTLHLQGYVCFKKPQRFTGVKTVVGNKAHIEKAQGNAESNRLYCSKEGKFEERGVMPRPGQRNDILAACRLGESGASELVLRSDGSNAY